MQTKKAKKWYIQSSL